MTLHVMLDIETWGKRAGCALRSVGAVMFDPRSDHLGPTFYANVLEREQQEYGLHMDAETERWWSEQSQEAQAPLLVEQRPLSHVIADFNEWYHARHPEAIWSHGAAFDLPIYEAAAHACGRQAPWGYRDARDTRTLFELVGGLRHDAIPFEGTKHHALDDARHQARLVQLAYTRLPRPNTETRVAVDNTVRQAYYGVGKQPWDTLLELGWGPGFTAGNVLKYLRRTKDAAEDLKKARWYWERLTAFAKHDSPVRGLHWDTAAKDLRDELSEDELRRLEVNA